jgi:hypothetical protein
VWLVAVGAAAILLAVVHLASTVPYVTLDGLATFVETEPFQRRALVPALAAVTGVVAGGGVGWRFLALETLAWAGLVGAARWALGEWRPDVAVPVRRWMALTVVVPVSVQLMLPARFRVFEGGTAVGDITALSSATTSIQALPGLYFPYDVPAAAFLLALIASASRLARRPTPVGWAAHAGLLMLAAANRETALIVVPFTVWILRHRLGRAAAVGVAAAQAVLVMGIVAALALAIGAPPNPRATHPGGAEWFVWTNARTLAHPLYLLTSLAPLAAGLWMVPVTSWARMSTAARDLVLWYVLPATAAALVWGSALETRVFTESATALWLVAATTLLPATASAAPPHP